MQYEATVGTVLGFSPKPLTRACFTIFVHSLNWARQKEFLNDPKGHLRVETPNLSYLEDKFPNSLWGDFSPETTIVAFEPSKEVVRGCRRRDGLWLDSLCLHRGATLNQPFSGPQLLCKRGPSSLKVTRTHLLCVCHHCFLSLIWGPDARDF